MSIDDITITPERLSQELTDFRKNHTQRKIVFVVGSGCSREANIDTGEQLARQWFEELKERLSEADLKNWIDNFKINIDDLGYHYTEIYKKRFERDRKSGFEFLTRLMEKGRPSAGHILLARALAKNDILNHRTIVTTNFDHLVEQSVYSYTSRLPFICGHESLAAYANNSLDHPLIVKVHRDIHFDPKNKTNETAVLDKGWDKLLDGIFDNSIAIVLGYGGNDGSLMNYLKLNSNITNIFWTIYDNTTPRQEIVELVQAKEGSFVRHQGFSLLMISIAKGLDIDFDVKSLKAESDDKINKFKEAIETLSKEVGTKGTIEEKKSLKDIAKQSERDWWTAQLEINAEKDILKQGEMYVKAMAEFPDSHELMENYALFLDESRKDYSEAEKYYIKALALAPDNANANCNYAIFLKAIRKNYTEAESYYKKALALDPDDADINSNYANFVDKIKKDYQEAEKHYKKALKLDPVKADNYVNYASFLERIKKDYISAEKYYKKSLELDPDNSFIYCLYAIFLESNYKNYQGAEKYYKKALDISPDDADINGIYSVFLQENTKNYADAEKYIQKALALDADNVNANSSYAILLHLIKKDYTEAEKYYKKAVQLNPDDESANVNYASLLFGLGRKKEALKYYQKVIESPDCPDGTKLELYFYQYAHLDNKEEAIKKIEELLASGARSEGWDFSLNIERAIADGHPDPDHLRDLAHRISGLDYSNIGIKK